MVAARAVAAKDADAEMSCFLSAMRTEGGGDVCGGDDGAESDARRVADWRTSAERAARHVELV